MYGNFGGVLPQSAFDSLDEILSKINPENKKNGYNPTRSQLREEAEITNGANQYNFTFKKNVTNNTIGVLQTLLDQSDAFICVRLGMFLLARDTTIAGAEQLLTYPNAVQFTASGATPAHLNIFYQAAMTFTLQTSVIYPAIRTEQFRWVPETQEIAAGATDSEFQGGIVGFIDLPQAIVLTGTRNSQLQLNVATFAGMDVEATVANFENRLVLIPDGWIIPNAAPAVDLVTLAAK